MITILKRNAVELRRLHQRVVEAYASRNGSPNGQAAREATLAEFKMRYDELAFPGGLRRELNLLKKGDLLAATQAIIFLENHPYFFRSQYIGTSLCRALSKIMAQLPGDLQGRFSAYKKLKLDRKRAKMTQ
jgi:hypothetical protein